MLSASGSRAQIEDSVCQFWSSVGSQPQGVSGQLFGLVECALVKGQARSGGDGRGHLGVGVKGGKSLVAGGQNGVGYRRCQTAMKVPPLPRRRLSPRGCGDHRMRRADAGAIDR